MNEKQNDSIYLFLDIDGVLCPKNRPVVDQAAQDWGQGWGKTFDEKCLAVFEQEVVLHPCLKIVISSNWRKRQTLENMKNSFSNEVAGMIVGVTPELNPTTRHYRFNEVLLYFKQNKLTNQNWITIDDDDEHFPKESLIVVTDTLKGFNKKSAQELTLLINKINNEI